MNKTLFLWIALFVFLSAEINAQTTLLVNENFNASSLPANWYTYNMGDTACNGQNWTFGDSHVPSASSGYDFSTNAAIFNDDAYGNTGNHNKSILYYGIIGSGNGIDLTTYQGLVTLSYDYAIYVGSHNSTLTLAIYDNSSGTSNSVWVPVFTYNANATITHEEVNLRYIVDYLIAAGHGIDRSNVSFGFIYDDGNAAWAWGAGVDNVKVEAYLPPANDSCSNATDITGQLSSTNVYTANNVDARGATNNGGFIATCPDGIDNGMNDGVWYSFNANFTGTITVSVQPDPDYDPQVAVFQGTSCANLTCVGTIDDGGDGTTETLTVDITSGNKYYINVGFYSYTYDNVEGTFNISVNSTAGISDQVISGLDIYPNPVKNILQVKALSAIDEINIYNLTGQLIGHFQPESEQVQLNTQVWRKGSYIVKVSTDNQTGVYHIVKE